MKNLVEVGVREVKMLEVIASAGNDTVNFGNFYVESEWEGLTKLKSVESGSCLIVRIEKSLFKELINIGNPIQAISKTDIISGSPSLLAKFTELKEGDQ